MADLKAVTVIVVPEVVTTVVSSEQNVKVVESSGQQGPPGPPGPAGGETYTHTQSAASAIWVIEHNLGRKPSVTVVDTADSVVFGSVIYLDGNRVRIEFSAPFSGSAYLN